jgi:hypothetical protein
VPELWTLGGTNSIKIMKQLIHNWWLGFRLLMRLVVSLVCIVAGLAMLETLKFVLMKFDLPRPFYVFLVLEVFYVVFFCPFILVSYARYCGFASRTDEHPTS